MPSVPGAARRAQARGAGSRRAGCQSGTEWRLAKQGATASYACNCPANPTCAGPTTCPVTPISGESWVVVSVSTGLCSVSAPSSATGSGQSSLSAVAAGAGAGGGSVLVIVLAALLSWKYRNDERVWRSMRKVLRCISPKQPHRKDLMGREHARREIRSPTVSASTTDPASIKNSDKASIAPTDTHVGASFVYTGNICSNPNPNP